MTDKARALVPTWADEPKVTQAELLLYGDYAGAVRMIGQAAAAAADAFSLVCKQLDKTAPTSVPEEGTEYTAWRQDLMETAYAAYLEVIRAHRKIAGMVLERLDDAGFFRADAKPVMSFAGVNVHTPPEDTRSLKDLAEAGVLPKTLRDRIRPESWDSTERPAG